MAEKNYEITVDELTLLKKVGVLTDPITGRELGIQQGAGKIYLKGEIVPASQVSPLLIAALEDSDHPQHESVSKKIREVSDDPRSNVDVRLGVPFNGYDEMDEEDILAALAVLPSATVQAVKEYEGTLGEPRERILNYSIGWGQDPNARQEGRVGSELDEESRDAADKASAKLTTREVTEEGVTPGEGITGTGDPDVPHGAVKAAEESEEAKPTRRRSRRTRSSQSDEGGEGSE